MVECEYLREYSLLNIYIYHVPSNDDKESIAITVKVLRCPEREIKGLLYGRQVSTFKSSGGVQGSLTVFTLTGYLRAVSRS